MTFLKYVLLNVSICITFYPLNDYLVRRKGLDHRPYFTPSLWGPFGTLIIVLAPPSGWKGHGMDQARSTQRPTAARLSMITIMNVVGLIAVSVTARPPSRSIGLIVSVIAGVSFATWAAILWPKALPRLKLPPLEKLLRCIFWGLAAGLLCGMGLGLLFDPTAGFLMGLSAGLASGLIVAYVPEPAKYPDHDHR